MLKLIGLYNILLVQKIISFFFSGQRKVSNIRNYVKCAIEAAFGLCKSISKKYSIFRKCYFPEMLFSGKENVFMCLVVFQKMFLKIFSDV